MKYADKRNYLPTLTTQNQKTIQSFDQVQYLKEDLEKIIEKIQNLLIEYSNLIDIKTVRNHQQMCYFFARRNKVNVSDCYQYSGIDEVKQELFGLNIVPMIPESYLLSLCIEKIIQESFQSQIKAEFIYEILDDKKSDIVKRNLILKSFIYYHFGKVNLESTPLLYQENFSPREIEKVKKYFL